MHKIFVQNKQNFTFQKKNKNIVKTINTKYKVAKNVKPFEIFVPP